MLNIKSLNQFYGGSPTLWDVDMTVPTGSITCLMGRNGMGKTTLLRSIMGLVKTQSGEIEYEGKDIRGFAAERRAPMGVGYVPQGREIFSQLTVEENLRVGLGIRNDGAFPSARRIFALFPVLQQMLCERGGDLSGGWVIHVSRLQTGQQRAILSILDEPTEGIQPN